MSTNTSRYNLVKPALTDTADITAMNANWDTIDGMLGIATTYQTVGIGSGQDLNAMKTNAIYQCGANAVAATLANCPTQNAFSMVVLPHAAVGCVQILTEYMTSGAKQFRRNFYSDSWGSWKEIPTKDDLAVIGTKQDSITGAATTITSSNLTANRAVVSNGSGKVAVSAVTDTELAYLSGVTSSIQTQLNAKQPTITGGATTITTSNLTQNRALASNGSGKVVASAVTATELGYLSGVTSNVQTQLNSKAANTDATTSAHGLMTAADKSKLNGIATGAEVNQNAFSNVVVGSTTLAADSKTDTLTITAGDNVTLTPNASGDSFVISARDTNTTYSAATQSANGLMSAADKKKLDGIAAGAEVNQNAFASVKVGSTTVYADGKSDTLTLTAGSNITLTPYASDDTITIAAKDTTYSDATTSTHGLMSTSDKTKLNGISSYAKNVHYVKAVTLTAAGGSIQEYSWSLSDLGVSSADQAGEKLFINSIGESRNRHYSYCYISGSSFYVVLANDSTDTVRAKIIVFRVD